VSHPLTIVRARESMRWYDSREYNDIFEGRYTRKPHYGGNGNGTNGNTSTSSEPKIVFCPHCGRAQNNQRFCSLCGGVID
jgi:hypothetical protein